MEKIGPKQFMEKVKSRAKTSWNELANDFLWNQRISRNFLRFPIPPNIDMEAEITSIPHLENCWSQGQKEIGARRLKLLQGFTTTASFITYTPTLIRLRTISIECQSCGAQGSDLLGEVSLKPKPFAQVLREFVDLESEKQRKEWLGKNE